MPRLARTVFAGVPHHVTQRGNRRENVFFTDDDRRAYLAWLKAYCDEHAVAILAYCLMTNHWHLLVRPEEDGVLSQFLGWITLTHTQRWHAHRHSAGSGHLYQGRFKSLPVQEDEHFYTVCRYVERNALRAKLVRRAEKWPWGSLGSALHAAAAAESPPLAAWPVPRSPQWVEHVNRPQTEAELDAIRVSIRRGRPFGSLAWQKRTAKRLGLESTFRTRGRPRQTQ